MSERAGLIIWPVGGALVAGLAGGLGGLGERGWWSHGASGGWQPAMLTAVVTAVLAASQVGALTVARRVPGASVPRGWGGFRHPRGSRPSPRAPRR